MGVIGIIGVIIQVLRYLPEVIGLINQLMALIRSLRGSPGFDEKAVIAEFGAALKEAKEKKDVSRLEKLHQTLGTHCANGVCDPAVSVPYKTT